MLQGNTLLEGRGGEGNKGKGGSEKIYEKEEDLYNQSLSYAGMNSIIVYMGSELLQNYFPFSWEGQNDSHLNLLAANLVAVSIWLVISYYWYWIGFFVKI